MISPISLTGGVELPFVKGDLEGFLKACPDPERSEGERMR